MLFFFLDALNICDCKEVNKQGLDKTILPKLKLLLFKLQFLKKYTVSWED